MGHSRATVKDQNYLSVSLNALKVNATILAMYLKPESFKDDSSAYNKEEADIAVLLLIIHCIYLEGMIKIIFILMLRLCVLN